ARRRTPVPPRPAGATRRIAEGVRRRGAGPLVAAAAGRRRCRRAALTGPGERSMILIDPPSVPARGRWWCVVVGDTPHGELHAFAERLGIPRVAFDRDHYDLPADHYEAALAAGAVAVSPKELVARLARSGLRRAKYPVRPRRLVPG